MQLNDQTRGFRPSVRQEWLLRACLLRGTAAREAWQRWRASADIDNLDAGSNRLLPLLYHNLRREQIEDPALPRWKGVYRYHWTQNEMLFHQVAPLLSMLPARGVDIVLLKGAALVARHYHDAGLRPMSDFDFLVRPEKARQAVEYVLASGWRLQDTTMSLDQFFRLSHSGCFVNERGQQIDLHWFALAEGQQPDADADFWAHTSRASLAGVAVRCLSPTDLLFHVCVHGAA